MKLTLLVAPLAIGLAASAAVPDPDHTVHKRDCNSGGDNWGAEKNYALNYASQVCLEAFSGHYEPGAQRAKCYNLASDKKVDFKLELRGDVNPRDIAAEECYDGLQKEINNCEHGGKTTYGNWKYSSDPNTGQCSEGTR